MFGDRTRLNAGEWKRQVEVDAEERIGLACRLALKSAGPGKAQPPLETMCTCFFAWSRGRAVSHPLHVHLRRMLTKPYKDGLPHHPTIM